MMIIEKSYSYSSGKMITKLTEKLDSARIEDYEVVEKIPLDVISIVPDPEDIRIYIPEDLDYAQYEIDDYLRKKERFIRTDTEQLNKNMLIMTLSGPLQFNQIYKLVEHVIEENGFCSLITI